MVEIPARAKEPCDLPRVGDNPTVTRLKDGYMQRGVEIVGCDGKRELAVSAMEAWAMALKEWAAQRERRERPWYQFWK